MQKKISTLSILLVALIVVFSSCTKGDIFSASNDIAGTWAVTGIRSDVPNDWDDDGYAETDIYGTYSYCQRNIVLVFDDYGTGQGRQGCNAYWQNLNWQLLNNGRTLRIDLLEDEIVLNNLRVNYNSMQGEDYVYTNGRNYTITYTLQRR
jgi:hypothetical protein